VCRLRTQFKVENQLICSTSTIDMSDSQRPAHRSDRPKRVQLGVTSTNVLPHFTEHETAEQPTVPRVASQSNDIETEQTG
jgi:hypothetical protein